MIKAKNHSLFTVGNTKTLKGQKVGYFTIILHLSPSTRNALGKDLCPYASQACRDTCLVDSGLSQVFKTVNLARERKTLEYLTDKKGFLFKLMQEIQYYRNKVKKLGLKLAVRLNGTSDISFHKLLIDSQNIFDAFPMVQFYDYTKNPYIVGASRKIKNYHITFSWSGENEQDCLDALQFVNVAVPFHIGKGDTLPSHFLGHAVINGDETDLRFLDKKKRVVGLKVKGNKQKKTYNNFLVTIERKNAA